MFPTRFLGRQKSQYDYIDTESVLPTTHEANEFSAQYDYVFVFPLQGTNHERQSKVAKHAFYQMLQAGLEVYPYRSVQEDELILLVRTPLEKLKEFADKIDFKLKINPEHLRTTLMNGDPERRIKKIIINDDHNITPYSPYDFIYLKYDKDFDQKLYQNAPGATHPFPKSIRLKLTYLLLRAPAREGGCGLEVSRLLHKKKILALFPLHDRYVSKAIMNKIWERSVWPWSVPFEDIREYYGEKIALYNVFLAHYSWWLWTPSIIGLAFQLVVWGTMNFSSPVLPFYSLVVTVWSIVMLEYWKRAQSTVALKWGMSDFERQEQDRPEFEGEVIPSYINGRDMTYYPPSKAKQLLALTRTVVISFIAMVCGIVAGIYILRIYLQKRNDTQNFASLIASVLNTVQIQVFNLIYQSIARALTDFENHRTDTEYEDRLIVKLFVFQFVNSYSSFFYLAFIASNLDRPSNAPDNYLGECGATNCMLPLSINLAIIFGVRLTFGNFLDIFLPYFTHKRKIQTETSGIAENKQITPAEKDYMLLNYETIIDSIQNYADTAVQYGFSLLFITALPCASFFSLISCYFKVKFNAWKLGTFYQRPIPQGAQDIGTWLVIFQVISVASVVTNAGLICFTMTVLWKYSFQGRVWIFVGFQWVLLGLQFLAQAIIPDVPHEVEIQLKRTEFMNDKVIEKVADDDYDEVDNDEDIDIGDEETTTNRRRCCGVVGRQRKTRVHRFNTEFPMRSYPFDNIPSSWPSSYSKTHEEVANIVPERAGNAATGPTRKTVEEEPRTTFQNFASENAAVGTPKKATAARNPLTTSESRL